MSTDDMTTEEAASAPPITPAFEDSPAPDGATAPYPAAPPAPYGSTASAAADPPRIRWAAIIWGLVFAVIAVIMIGLLSDDRRSDGVSDWIMSLTPGSITAIVLLALGGVVLICGTIGLIRRLQRKAAVGRSAQPMGS